MEEVSETQTSLLRWGLVSKYRNQLFGFAILWIMFMHSNEFTPIKENGYLSHYILYDGMILVGGVGVDIFLFLSGMGLFYALCKKPTLGDFYRKRLKRILIPYVIIGTLFWIFKDFIQTFDPVMFFRDLSLSTFVTHGNSTFWYIFLILPLYLVAPLVCRLMRSRFRSLTLILSFLLCAALNLCLSVYHPTLFQNIEKATTRIFIFILGCYFGPIIQEDRPINNLWVLYGFLTLTCHGLVNYAAKAYPILSPKIIGRFWCNAAGFALCILIPICLEVLDSRRLNKFLGFFGAISLELYLSHVALKSIVKRSFPNFTEWSAARCIVVYGCVLLCAVIFSQLFHIVQQKLEQTYRMRRKSAT